jgi:hypothetical protein
MFACGTPANKADKGLCLDTPNCEYIKSSTGN